MLVARLAVSVTTTLRLYPFRSWHDGSTQHESINRPSISVENNVKNKHLIEYSTTLFANQYSSVNCERGAVYGNPED